MTEAEQAAQALAVEQAKAAEAAKTAAAPKPVATVDPRDAEIAALKKSVADTNKTHAEFLARVESPGFMAERIAKALNIGVEVDPKVALQDALTARKTAEAAATSAVIRNEATVALVAAGVKPDRIKHALRNLDLSAAKVNLSTGAIENADVVASALASLKTDLPEFFSAPAAAVSPSAAAERVAPGVPPRVPATGQPASTPAGPLWTPATARTLSMDEARKAKAERAAARNAG